MHFISISSTLPYLLQRLANKDERAMLDSLKELVDAPIISDGKNHLKSIGVQKSYVTGIVPSITKIISKTCRWATQQMQHTLYRTQTFFFVHWLATSVWLKRVSLCDIFIINSFKRNRVSVGKNAYFHRYSILIPYVVLQDLDNLKGRGGKNEFTMKHNAT